MLIVFVVFVVGFLLVVWGDRLLEALYRNQGAEIVQRKQELLTPCFWIVMSLGVLAMDIMEMLQGVVEGIRIGVLTRAQHPVLFWAITLRRLGKTARGK
jgi:hypothetical protein